ncbi:acetyl-CoA acetyltransferase [Nocardia sp. 852002-20019_SCH5090214]|jgi:acetyl-CoA C-acetyltransferase|uniref:thiolase family protein n=1 Tax=Nocardia TaxID=1817 RepID=UPI0007A55E20|nr:MULTISPECIES: thiolase family protein [Nocardia]MBV7704601.1 thiolase family protein [Nocardia nova]OBA44192.1 acetyl-CoA acetyltransferase [Nocardia sp. 852002-20019_SCH5090214]PPI92132.1 acetyl-CoA C-acyltransferase [Nocardia nova]PPJ05372.1 acetyl-CoA C-acyltransferase [Nocardia nova]
MSHEAVIISGARTAIGTAYKGSLTETDAFTLGTAAVAEAVRRAGVEPDLVDDVILGESLYGGGAIGRYVAIEAGLVNAPGIAHNRHCASGLSTLQSAAASVIAGMDRIVVAGGVQSSSTAPTVNRRIPGSEEWEEDWLAPSHRETPDAPVRDMSITVGWNAAVKAGITRAQMDEWALRSHQRAVAAIDAGSFTEEIVPIEVTRRDGSTVTFAVDEHPRRTSSLEKLASLKPLHPEIEGFGITAGNAAGINDAAGAVVVADRALARERGIEPLAVVRAWASVGVAPADTGLAPAPAIEKVLARAGLSVGDVALWEINEAFASVAVAATRALGLDEEKVNVLGSGCSLGHPVAMTGTRMVLSLVHELRRRGGGVGVAAMCAGGGMGTAVVVDVP